MFVRFLRAAFAALFIVAPAAAQEPASLRIPASGQAAPADSGSVFFVGTATVIIRYAGLTILTDPNFLHKGEHVHLGYGLTSQRLTDPAIPLEKLPPIDLIVLSHFHEDHFDKLVMEKLDKATPIVSTAEAVKHLREHGFTNVYALAKWGRMNVEKGTARLAITAMPARHGPPVVNHALPETMGSLLEFEQTAGSAAYRMYISGDTLVYEDLQEIPKRFPNINLALMHLGGTRAAGVLVTMDAEQGVEAIRIVNPDLTIPIHYDDYTVFKSPLSEFLKAIKAAGIENKVHVLQRGETYTFRVAGAQAR